MCAIFGSFDKEKFKELHKLNLYRGELSSSLAEFDRDSLLISLKRSKDKMNYTDIDALGDNSFIVGHIQAPTSESSNIHPASRDGSLLWHNGIVKASKTEGWDTQWMLDNLVSRGVHILSEVDGTFACVYYDRGIIYLFRNEISPLFIDSSLNFSSTKFEGSESLTPNKVFCLDLQKISFEPVFKFETLENPYFFI